MGKKSRYDVKRLDFFSLCLENMEVKKLHLFCPYCMSVWQGDRLMSWQEYTSCPVEREILELFKTGFKSTSQLLFCISWHSCLSSPLWLCPFSLLAPWETSQASEKNATGCEAWVAKAQTPCHLGCTDAHWSGAACYFFQGCWKSQQSECKVVRGDVD